MSGAKHGKRRRPAPVAAVWVRSVADHGPVAPKPLYRDPVYDGAADPLVVWHRAEKAWWMLYSNRRANIADLPGVSWCHGTRIGLASSTDGGVTWTYRGTAVLDWGGEEVGHWAPDVVYHDGTYHMYLSFVPGIHLDWGIVRHIIHLTSDDLQHWRYRSTLPLASDRVIDASIARLPDGSWRLWYKNEADNSAIYYADSPDLFTWTDGGVVVRDEPGEGAKVFFWHKRWWMIVDHWKGMSVYHSPDALTWTRQPGYLLGEPGTGNEDQVIGGHADVVVGADNSAFIFYFTHPGRAGDGAGKDTCEQRRTSIQVAELEFENGVLLCDRDKPTHLRLLPVGDE